MEFLTSTILSGVLYDILKNGVAITGERLKDKLRDWVLDDNTIEKMALSLEKLELTDEQSETAIRRRIEQDSTLTNLMSAVQKLEKNTIIQTHSGSGDNVGRDKIIN